jgi:hypothetical protein
MPEPLSSHPKSELEEALDETIDTDLGALPAAHPGQDHAGQDHELGEAGVARSLHASYKDAIEKKKRHWKDDRDQVLERACQVGYLSAYFAALRSIFDELRRAGIPLDPGEPGAPGQDIWLEPAYQPLVDSRIAKRAACFIDCDMKRDREPRPTPQFIWCPTPTTARLHDLMAIALPRRMARDEVEQATARIGKALLSKP